VSRDLPAGVRLGAFAGVLVLAFGAAYVVGDAVVADDREVFAQRMTEIAEAVEPQPAVPAGLTASRDGYTVRPVETVLPAGAGIPFAFTITGPDGRPVTDVQPTHERDLHLIAVRRDLAGFQHVHPERAPDGTWSVPLDLTPGTHRVFADFATPDGQTRTLGADVQVPGEFTPAPPDAPVATDVVDGYEVRLDGATSAGEDSVLAFTVTREGEPVTDVQPYLGAYGHLVALRAGDLAYLHTHALDEAVPGETGGPVLSFRTRFPSAGEYRVYLDFQVGGQVRTADFTVEVPSGTAPSPSEPASSDDTPHGH
jgi:hypothetical protein